jgi:hypothetical protein
VGLWQAAGGDVAAMQPLVVPYPCQGNRKAKVGVPSEGMF